MLIIFDILYELDVFAVNLDMIFGITDEQKALFSDESIYQYNALFLPYLLNEIETHKSKEKHFDQEFFEKLYDYIFSMYYETFPLEQVTFGEIFKNRQMVYGLKLKEKDITLADFLEMLCCDEIVDILYKKSYGKDKCYLAESLRCTYYIALGLEIIISE